MRIVCIEEIQKFLLLLLFVQVLSSFLAILNTIASILTSFLYIEFSLCLLQYKFHLSNSY